MSKVVWLPPMFKRIAVFAITSVIVMQTLSAFGGVSRSMMFQISVTIPEHVILNGVSSAPFANNPYQLVQTQTVVRNNKTIQLRSIVVP
jgi:hypothetical protein